MSCCLCSSSSSLLSSLCSHLFCDPCLGRQLLRGPFACPVCAAPVSRAGMKRVALRNDYSAAGLARELKLRRRLAKIFNRERQDFADDQEAFYRYQEMVEDIAYRAVRGEDVEAEIAAYKSQNAPAIVARNQENEVRARAQRESDLRDAEERVRREQELREQDRKEAIARAKEREKAMANIQRGEMEANEAAKRVEANMSKRRKRDEEAEEQAKEQEMQQQQQKLKKEKSAMPRPIGAVALMANEQKTIGNSYMGQLTPEQLNELYKRTACTSQGYETVLRRARHEAGLK